MNRLFKVFASSVAIFLFSISTLQINPFVYNVSALELGYFRGDGSYQVTDVQATWDEIQDQFSVTWQDVKGFVQENYDKVKDSDFISFFTDWYDSLNPDDKEDYSFLLQGVYA